MLKKKKVEVQPTPATEIKPVAYALLEVAGGERIRLKPKREIYEPSHWETTVELGTGHRYTVEFGSRLWLFDSDDNYIHSTQLRVGRIVVLPYDSLTITYVQNVHGRTSISG